MYIIDNRDEQVNCRMNNLGCSGEHVTGAHLNRQILHILQDMLHEVNPYVSQFKQTLNMLENNEIQNDQLHITSDGIFDCQQYNQPSGHGQHEVAAFIPGNEHDSDYTMDRREI